MCAHRGETHDGSSEPTDSKQYTNDQPHSAENRLNHLSTAFALSSLAQPAMIKTGGQRFRCASVRQMHRRVTKYANATILDRHPIPLFS